MINLIIVILASLHGRIPRKISDFNEYVIRTDNDLTVVVSPSTLPTWQRLGLTSANQALWHAGRLTWEPLYALYSNPLTKTATVVGQVKEFMIASRTNINPMLNIMAASPNAWKRDEDMYNFVRTSNRKPPTRKTTPIREECLASIVSDGGGKMRFKCRSIDDGSRPSLPPNTGLVEVLCRATSNPVDPTQGFVLPSDYNDPSLNIRGVFSKAIFELKLDPGVRGKVLEGYVRWRDTHNPNRVGGWTQIPPTVIT